LRERCIYIYIVEIYVYIYIKTFSTLLYSPLDIEFKIYKYIDFEIYIEPKSGGGIDFEIYLDIDFEIYLDIDFEIYLDIDFEIYLDIDFEIYTTPPKSGGRYGVALVSRID